MALGAAAASSSSPFCHCRVSPFPHDLNVAMRKGEKMVLGDYDELFAIMDKALEKIGSGIATAPGIFHLFRTDGEQEKSEQQKLQLLGSSCYSSSLNILPASSCAHFHLETFFAHGGGPCETRFHVHR